MTTEQLLEIASKLVGKTGYEIALELSDIYHKGEMAGIEAMANRLLNKPESK